MGAVEAPIQHIAIDDRGRAFIRTTTCKVTEIIALHRYWEQSPEEIHAGLPQLSLAQIYAAFSYYYDHQPQIDAQMKADSEEAERLRIAAGPHRVTREQLLARQARERR